MHGPDLADGLAALETNAEVRAPARKAIRLYREVLQESERPIAAPQRRAN